MREIARCQPGLMTSHTGGHRCLRLARLKDIVHAGRRVPLRLPPTYSRNGVQGRVALLQTPTSASGNQRKEAGVSVKTLERKCFSIPQIVNFASCMH